MRSPTHKEGGYSAAELQSYARQRAREQLQNMKIVAGAARQGSVDAVEEHEEHREPLEVAVQKRVTVRLSWGGDGDGFRLIVDNDGQPASGVYFWEDWGVYEEVRLSSEELDLVFDYYYLEGMLVE